MAETHAITTRATELIESYERVREFTEKITSPLSAEDCSVQSMPDVSPTRWHLAHTTWFFETFVLSKVPGYREFREGYAYLFNSYYNTVGRQFPRPSRGVISRPGLEEIFAYRHHVDERMHAAFQDGSHVTDDWLAVIELGLHHAQQHQELI
ncbi:MAG: DinB family protein, partial [Planctomycetes bacterium]|nr:DinB family protein [Planctomycetota bacterium]